MHIDDISLQALRTLEESLTDRYEDLRKAGLQLDLTRGKPSAEQLSLSDALDGIMANNYRDEAGTDLRNYGGIDGIPAAKKLFSEVLGVSADEIMIGGNSSLTMMHFAVSSALYHGVSAANSAWIKEDKTIKFLAPVPGYDRHFTVCEHLGIELIPVAMNKHGPVMDEVERLLAADPQIKGIWCVPRFSNPSGIVYSDAVVDRMAQLARIAGPNFRIFWDNAYAVHSLSEDAPALANIMDCCREYGTEDSVYIFGSTSKITFAGAGVAFLGASKANLNVLKTHFGFSSIGPDKINQERHVRFLKNIPALHEHMNAHAAILKPRFDAVLSRLESELSGTGMAEWTVPQGGYFISLDTRPGLAKTVVQLAADLGVKLTPAGATYPYGKDPDDRNIRLAPSFPSLAEVEKTTDAFIVCLKLASVRQALTNRA